MDALPPLPLGVTAAALPAQPVGSAILLTLLADELASLPPNAIVDAIVAKLAQNLVPQLPGSPTPVQLVTPQGAAVVSLPVPVEVGDRVQIQVSAARNQPVQWRLISINDRPVTVLVTPAPVVATPATLEPLPPALPQRQGLVATLLQSKDATLPNGASFLVRVRQIDPPPSPPPPETADQPAVTPQPGRAPEFKAPVTQANAITLPPADGATPSPERQASSNAPTLPQPAALPEQRSVTITQTPAQSSALTLEPTTISGSPAAISLATPAETNALPEIIPSAAPVAVADSAPSTVTVASGGATAPWRAANAQPTAAAPTTLATVQATLPPTLAGRVLPNLDTGRVLLQAPIGVVALPPEHPPIMVGSQMVLNIVDRNIEPALTTSAPQAGPPKWGEKLAHIIEQLRPVDKQLAAQIETKIPTAGIRLASQLVAFTQMMEGDGWRKWLGAETMESLARTLPSIFADLGRSPDINSQAVQGPTEGDWQKLAIPFLFNGQMTMLQLSARRRPRNAWEAQLARDSGERFLLDIELSQLGPLQFDGLVKRKAKNFDLIIRSEQPLPAEMRRDIDSLFLQSLVSFGLQGSVAFMPGAAKIATPPLKASDNGIIFA